MCVVDDKDRVIKLEGIPQSCTGAPLPVVVADEGAVFVAYRVATIDPSFDGTNPRNVSAEQSEKYAILEFREPSAHMFGYPNDEALAGHPLYGRGLSHYGAFEVQNSSWIRRMARANEICFPKSAWLFEKDRHFILCFHDSTFECVAREIVSRGTVVGSRREVIAHLNDLLGEP